MENIERLLAQLREELGVLRASARALPPVVTKKMAQLALSVGATTLDSMIKSGELATCKIGKRKMVPASEIYRLSQPARPAVRSSGRRSKKADGYDQSTAAAELAERRRKKNEKLRKKR